MILYMPRINIFIILVFVFIILVAIMIFKSFKYENLYIKFFSLVGLGVINLIIGFVFVAMLSFQLDDVLDYAKNNYLIVEGEVSNFRPSKQIGKKNISESFEINGVKFEYHNDVIRSGYKKIKKNGGVIKMNGQYLKIGYTQHYDYNAIIFIEEPPFSTKIDNFLPIKKFILNITLLFICFLIAFVAFFRFKRKRVYVDYYHSYINNVKVIDDKLLIECSILIINSFAERKKVKISAKFRIKDKSKQSKTYNIYAIDFDSLCDVFNIKSGQSRFTVIFQHNENINYDIDSIGAVLPKIKLINVAKR